MMDTIFVLVIMSMVFGVIIFISRFICMGSDCVSVVAKIFLYAFILIGGVMKIVIL